MTRRHTSGEESPAPYHLSLPLWRRVVFVDWFGVLSTDLFWHSILSRQTHPIRTDVEEATAQLFQHHQELVRDWMRGRTDAATVVRQMDLELDRRFKPDFLLRRLLEDCHKMKYRSELMASIRRTAVDAHIVIATDNMDCFASQIRGDTPSPFGADDVLVSSRLGVLKTDSVEEFFGPWLHDHSLTFGEATLIDDNPRTCDAFQARGGTAILFEDEDRTVDALAAIWVAHASSAAGQELPRRDGLSDIASAP